MSHPQTLKELLILREGVRLKPYRDTKGFLTIGVGRNLDGVGISLQEALNLLDSDLSRARREAYCEFPWFDNLSSVRKDVVVSMIFNVGLQKFLGFHKAIAALEQRAYSVAADELLDSKWADEVGAVRSNELAEMLRSDCYPGADIKPG